MSKQEKRYLAPELRFPEFNKSLPWEPLTLSELSNRIVTKVGEKKLITVSITAGKGFVSQTSKFSRDISGKQYKNYIHLKRGDFSYNKGNSKKFAQGCVYKLKEFDEVAAPNAFLSFTFKEDYIPDFYQGYFDSNAHGKQLRRFITSGARSDGLLNIKPNDFFSIVLPTPNELLEQRKVADCLSSLEQLIIAQSQKYEVLKTYKKALMQQLFPVEGEKVPELRFPEFNEDEAWKETSLNELGELVSGLTYKPTDVKDEGLLVLRSSNVQDNEIKLDDNVYVDPSVNGINLSKPNDILICVRNGSKKLIGKNALIPDGLPICTHGAFMTVFRAPSAKFLFQLFQTYAYKKQVNSDLGATINSINGKRFIKYKFYIPNPNEQQKIANFLSSLDKLISLQNKKVETLKLHKKGLIQSILPKMDEINV
ncbi:MULTISPECIES: restriction endonuclease subunit S [unclassified Pseudoalteromonas]|uniref:restriction endonuclease subunit S n=1 Tax=unclassified Pseudoalteromonas TaxID=194690 RepID=UPI00048B67ED|nr:MULTISPECIES: restriction endonuclease subunit S [unclassified Pseudoalteromonas]